MSVGNITQTIQLDTGELNLVLGENLDLGGDDNRNGVGKSSILNAISYVLYDNALTKIRKDNLVNKTNSKDMYVTLDFEKDGTKYRLERGRKPNKLKFFVDGNELEEDKNEAQGDMRVTQTVVEEVIGISHTMFKNIVGLNTNSEPFLSMRANDQREVIEQLLGITKLSEKAEVLKVLLKNTKELIRDEEAMIKATEDANKTIEKNIKSLEMKSSIWDKNNNSDIENTHLAIEELQKLDIDVEIEAHKTVALATEYSRKFNEYDKEINGYNREMSLLEKSITRYSTQLEQTNDKTCHTCGHSLDDDKHQELHEKLMSDLKKDKGKLADVTISLGEVISKQKALEAVEMPETFYDNVDEAYSHRSKIESLTAHLTGLEGASNPYVEQIETLKEDGLQTVDYSNLNDLVMMRDHQDFLLKLLTNKDSFIRKRIIDQNLNYLNARLEHYLIKVGLPHEVSFVSDLSVEITEHGRGLDFDNLSRGEKTRLILSLSWAFRDVFESLNGRINILFIDELMDNGLDTSGVENSLRVLKHITRDLNKSIFLISHREELIGRVDNIVKVIKTGGFTTIEDYDE